MTGKRYAVWPNGGVHAIPKDARLSELQEAFLEPKGPKEIKHPIIRETLFFVGCCLIVFLFHTKDMEMHRIESLVLTVLVTGGLGVLAQLVPIAIYVVIYATMELTKTLAILGEAIGLHLSTMAFPGGAAYGVKMETHGRTFLIASMLALLSGLIA